MRNFLVTICLITCWAAVLSGNNRVAIQGAELAVTIAARGAELQSIIHIPTGTEYIWQGDPAYWASRSPNMFPVNVRFKDERFTYQGKEYTMPRMGLAQDADFIVSNDPGDPLTAKLILNSNASTLRHYPFPFRLEILFEVKGLKVIQRFGVTNTGTETLYFALGGHPGIRTPLVGGRTRGDYQYTFPEALTLDRTVIENSLVTNTRIPFLEGEDRLSLDDDRVPGGGMFLQEHPARQIGVALKGRPPYVTVDLQDFPNTNLWSPPGMPYACIEPMVGHHDFQETDSAIEKKGYLIELPAGETRYYQYAIIIDPQEGSRALGPPPALTQDLPFQTCHKE